MIYLFIFAKRKKLTFLFISFYCKKKCFSNVLKNSLTIMKNYLKLIKDTMLLFTPVKMKMQKKFVHTHLFYVLGLNIFVRHSLMNGPIKKMEISFLKNQTFLLKYYKLF